VDLPGLEDRKAILQILLRDEQLAQDVDLDRLAKETDGFSGSDLKHLCVSAALSAIKDIVKVPWSRGGATKDGQPVVPVVPPPSSGSIHEDELLVVSTDADVEQRQQKKEQPQPVTSMQPPMSYISEDRTFAPPITGSTAVSAEADKSGEHDTPEPAAKPGETTENTESEETTEQPRIQASDEPADEQESSPKVDKVALPRRTVSRKHFDMALSEIRPSSNEEGSLPELRKWAKQFGEGGTEKGRRKGFGKGFGFNDPADVKDRDSGYGKVAEDES